MNATHNRPVTGLYQDTHQRFVARIEEIQAIVRPGSSSTPHAALETAVAALEKLIPSLSQYLASQSLLSQDWDTNGRQKMEEQLNQSRSKLRELQVLLESARRLLGEQEAGGSSPMAEALNTYLGPSLDDMKEAILAQAEVRTGSNV
jgi:ElaB/YqjD/DUF883 family membrane-anchored ribosome-binding protein